MIVGCEKEREPTKEPEKKAIVHPNDPQGSEKLSNPGISSKDNRRDSKEYRQADVPTQDLESGLEAAIPENIQARIKELQVQLEKVAGVDFPSAPQAALAKDVFSGEALKRLYGVAGENYFANRYAQSDLLSLVNKGMLLSETENDSQEARLKEPFARFIPELKKTVVVSLDHEGPAGRVADAHRADDSELLQSLAWDLVCQLSNLDTRLKTCRTTEEFSFWYSASNALAHILAEKTLKLDWSEANRYKMAHLKSSTKLQENPFKKIAPIYREGGLETAPHPTHQIDG